jgi:alpha-glucosidase
MYQNLGVKAVKTGYAIGIQTKGQFHHGQFMVNHYKEVVKTAAKYKIMINAHKPIKPTGIRRIYPNMMTREGTRGMEWNAWSSGNPPKHCTISPFTRAAAGPIIIPKEFI